MPTWINRFCFATVVAWLSAVCLVGCTSDGPGNASPKEKAPPTSPIGFVKGHSWGYPGIRGRYDSDGGRESILKMKSTNAEWICIANTVQMETVETPEIIFGDANQQRVSDAELEKTIAYAKENGLRTILKPMVDSRDGQWRALIGFKNEDGSTDTDAWDQWWTSYEACMVHYAKIASRLNCDLFCVGCEMESTQSADQRWRELIANVREHYTGPVTYDVNWSTAAFPNWLEDLDLISVSAYYHIGVEYVESEGRGEWVAHKTLEDKCNHLERMVEQLRVESERFDLPILFIETGCRSAARATHKPWKHPDVNDDYDAEEQRQFYEAMFRTMWNKPWFIGYCWWDWPTLMASTETDRGKIGFYIFGKPAEAVVRNWYAKPEPLRN